MASNILNNKGKTEVYRRDRSMVSSKAGTNLCLFVLVLQGMTSNILNNKGKEEVHRTPDRSMVSSRAKNSFNSKFTALFPPAMVTSN